MANKEIKKLRKEQQEKVMREIGGLLDAWMGLSTDAQRHVAEESPAFIVAISRIYIAVES